jgi:hypothetical protein
MAVATFHKMGKNGCPFQNRALTKFNLIHKMLTNSPFFPVELLRHALIKTWIRKVKEMSELDESENGQK